MPLDVMILRDWRRFNDGLCVKYCPRYIMSNENEPGDGWEPCRPGLIQQASLSAIDQRRRAFLIKCSAGAVAAFGGLMAVSNQLGTNNNKNQVVVPQQVVGCKKVLENLGSYVRDEIEDKEFYAGITRHLNVCHYCENVHQETIREFT